MAKRLYSVSDVGEVLLGVKCERGPVGYLISKRSYSVSYVKEVLFVVQCQRVLLGICCKRCSVGRPL